MPSGMRNATPGPSARNPSGAQGAGAGAGAVVQGRPNVLKKKEGRDRDRERERQKALKRPSSEEPLDEEERERKKARFVGGVGGDFDSDDAPDSRDNKERRKRRRKRRKPPLSVVVAGSSEPSQRTGQQMTVHTSSGTVPSGSHGQVAARFSVVDVNGVKVEDEADDEAPTYSSSDKGKGRAKADSLISLTHENSNLINPGSGNTSTSDTLSTALSTAFEGPDPSSEVARLKEQLAEQRMLLERHQSHLNQQQQVLTCQICLELMHRPYALTPCGHVTCYGCLVRWFTSDLSVEEPMDDDEEQEANENENVHGNDVTALLNTAAARGGTFVRRRKTCPVCRGVVVERPVEMWDIKTMVSALVKSHLVDLPVSPGAVVGESSSGHEGGGNNTPPNDPWRNVFKPGGLRRGYDRRGGPPPPGQEDDENEREQFGWYDQEDGGVYRCVECFHELWGGMCTFCERIYPGHEFVEEEDEDSDDFGEIFYEDGDENDDAAPFGIEEVDYVGYLQDIIRRVDEEQGAWSVGGDSEVEGDIDVESSDGFIDDEEVLRTRSSDVNVDSDDEEESESVRWARGRHLHAWGEEDETSLYEESAVGDIGDRMGWGWDYNSDAVDDTEEEIRRSPSPPLRRSTRTPVARTVLESEDDEESDSRSPPQWRSARIRRRTVIEDDSEDEDESEEESEVTFISWRGSGSDERYFLRSRTR